MLKMKWKSLLALFLLLTVVFFAGCSDEESIEDVYFEEYTLTVNISNIQSRPIIKVYDDGEKIDSEEGSLARFDLNNGNYTLKIEADGYDDEIREVSINNSDESLNLDYAKLNPLTVNIESGEAIPTTKVYDGEEEIASKEGNSVRFNLNNGIYNLEVKTDDYNTKNIEISIDDRHERLDLKLSEKLAPKDNWEAGEGWELEWSDEFDSTTIDKTNWTRQLLPAGAFNEELQEYTASPENSYIKRGAEGNGAMVIEARHEGGPYSVGNFTSARMITNEKAEFKYGKIAARIKVPHGQGIWPAFWMLGTNIDETGGDTPWPWSGEIDIMEKVGGVDEEGNSNETVAHGTIHYATCGYEEYEAAEDKTWRDCYNYTGGSKTIDEYLSAEYRVYEIEWDEKTIIWRLDGEEYHREDISSSEFDEFREEFYIILNVAVGGWWANDPNHNTEFPSRMYIDWVRVYQ